MLYSEYSIYFCLLHYTIYILQINRHVNIRSLLIKDTSIPIKIAKISRQMSRIPRIVLHRWNSTNRWRCIITYARPITKNIDRSSPVLINGVPAASRCTHRSSFPVAIARAGSPTRVPRAYLYGPELQSRLDRRKLQCSARRPYPLPMAVAFPLNILFMNYIPKKRPRASAAIKRDENARYLQQC